MNKIIFIAGLGLLMLGFFLIIFSLISSSAKTKIALGGFIGFIPFGFANDKRMLYFVLGLSFVIFLIWAILYFLNLKS